MACLGIHVVAEVFVVLQSYPIPPLLPLTLLVQDPQPPSLHSPLSHPQSFSRLNERENKEIWMSAGSWVHSSCHVLRPVTQNNLWSWDKADNSRWPYKEIFLPELDLIPEKCHWVIDNTTPTPHPAGSRRIFISISLHNDAFHLDQGEMTVLQLWNK